MTKDILIYALGFAALSGWASALVIALMAGAKAADLENAIERWKRELVKCFRSPRRVEKIRKAWVNIQDSPTLPREAMLPLGELAAIGLTLEVVQVLEELDGERHRQKTKEAWDQADTSAAPKGDTTEPPATITGPSFGDHLPPDLRTSEDDKL